MPCVYKMQLMIANKIPPTTGAGIQYLRRTLTKDADLDAQEDANVVDDDGRSQGLINIKI